MNPEPIPPPLAQPTSYTCPRCGFGYNEPSDSCPRCGADQPSTSFSPVIALLTAAYICGFVVFGLMVAGLALVGLGVGGFLSVVLLGVGILLARWAYLRTALK